jgi:hypothetical protein
MEAMRVERLDHLGLIASVINDLGLVSMIDARLKPDAQEVTVQAVKTGIMRRLEIADPVQAGERGRVHHATPLHARP